MKIKSLAIVLFVLAANTISAQSTFEKWPAIKAFHEVMSQTFHPSEEGNLEPIKTRSEELMNSAAAVNIHPRERPRHGLDTTLRCIRLRNAALGVKRFPAA